METAVVVGMSTGMMILVGVIMFIYRKFIFRSAEVLEISATRMLDVIDDSSATYTNKVYILNAQTRNEQAKEIAEIEMIVSNKDIMEMLQAKTKASRRPQAQK